MPLFIMDVCDVTFTRKSDGHVVFTSEAQTSTLSQTVDEETIQGGIGSRSIYTIKSNKAVELTVRNATFDLEWLAMTQGVKTISGNEFVVKKKIEGVLGEDLSIDAPESVADGDTISVLNKHKQSTKVTVATGSATVEAGFAEPGDKVQIVYDATVTGDTVEMRADKFAEKYEVQYNTVVYDADTEAHVYDLYINFFEVSPSSAFDMSLENGTAFTPELTFQATSNENAEIGTFSLVEI